MQFCYNSLIGDDFKNIGMQNINNSLFNSMQFAQSNGSEIPLFLATKIKNEEIIIDQFIEQIKHQIPKIFSHDQKIILDEIEKKIGGIL